jgi:hypothetical protein
VPSTIKSIVPFITKSQESMTIVLTASAASTAITVSAYVASAAAAHAAHACAASVCACALLLSSELS